ncbi:MAG: TIGR03905 family TSCPD domain-containing protein [Clostridia bacterium]|nr:TIGR03905 family TSCPD domain-containing protein [Clostridia bacterium]
MHTYKTLGTCSRQILFEVENDTVKNVKFIGGCSGNLQGIAKLVENNSVDNVINLLKGIKCRNGTSCPDQLAKALEEYKMKNK